MGTNYYTLRGEHLGKTSTMGGQRYQFIAQQGNYPDKLGRTVVDEYGIELTRAAFEALVAGAASVDYLSGEFS